MAGALTLDSHEIALLLSLVYIERANVAVILRDSPSLLVEILSDAAYKKVRELDALADKLRALDTVRE
jgi:hypothetical protein